MKIDNWERDYWFLASLAGVVALYQSVASDFRGLEGHVQHVRDHWLPLGSFWSSAQYAFLALATLYFVVRWARA